jgi:hypothetical protein
MYVTLLHSCTVRTECIIQRNPSIYSELCRHEGCLDVKSRLIIELNSYFVPYSPHFLFQFNAAAMRAALGLPPAAIDDAWYFQQAQQQQQQQQQAQQQQARQQTTQQDLQNLQLRQLLLQEQLEQQVQDHKIRALGEQLQDYPDLQRHYQNLMLNEQLQRQRSGGLGANAFPAASVQQQAEFLREQASALRQHLTLRQYEELLRRQHTQQQLTNFRSDSFGNDSATALFAQAQAKGQPQNSQVQAAADYVAQLAAAAAQQQVQRQQQQQDVATLAAKLLASSPPQAMATSTGIPSPAAANLEDGSAPAGRKQSIESVDTGNIDDPYKKKRAKVTNSSLFRNEDESPSSYVEYDRASSAHSPCPSNGSVSEQPYTGYPANHSLETFAYAADLAQPALFAKGTVEGLLQASEDCEKLTNAASVLVTKLAADEDWSDSDSEDHEVIDSITNVPNPAESVRTRSFQSSLPSLPEEPLLVDDDFDLHKFHASFGSTSEISRTKKDDTPKKRKDSRKLPPLLEPVHAVDTWWPSMSGMRKERKSLGETSDEDNFEDDSDEETFFRVNKQKIRNRLARIVEPGVLEKLPHCKIHRLKCKGKKIPELVFCFQVTELYPNDVMVNCSICGTWRHATCGGHYKPYSTRENTKTPFVAICVNCHEEKNLIADFPQSVPRLERQRQEQIRRAHATSAVMRHSSFSKHGGTYKWPLGSVSATHIGGHTRSVHVRHDKAEKQWSDMANRLNRGTGYRQKERIRSRTKELERLLVAIEDAESYTDRHNMLLFLLRDTAKAVPAGFQHELCNIFDPADDHLLRDECSALHRHVLGEVREKMNSDESSSTLNNDDNDEDQKVEGEMYQSTGICSRIGCERKHRFDSSFCSDACGLATLEMDLLKTFHDASDIHPSVLRLA